MTRALLYSAFGARRAVARQINGRRLLGLAFAFRTRNDRPRGTIAIMADDLIPILARFHREVVLPDIQRIVGSAVGDIEGRMNAHFDEIYKRFDRLEAEYHMLAAGLQRVEDRLDAVEKRLDKVEQKLDRVALKSELLELKARVDGLQQQVRALEERLGA
jgi:polyhydroxyalkanoate synthesis regulator phasin